MPLISTTQNLSKAVTKENQNQTKLKQAKSLIVSSFIELGLVK